MFLFDEILIGKPWCGNGGFNVDDRVIQPSESVKTNREEINTLLAQENQKGQQLCS